MRIAKIAGADPTPLGAPSDWRPDENGHCGALFVRRETLSGVLFMRSAWKTDQGEALRLLAGGTLILGVAGSRHPVVHLEVEAPSVDGEPVYAFRRVVDIKGRAGARVDASYPRRWRPPLLLRGYPERRHLRRRRRRRDRALRGAGSRRGVDTVTEIRLLDSAPVGTGIIAALEDMLARAKAEQLSSVAIAVVFHDGSTGDAWSEPPSVSTLIGSVAILQSKLCATITSEKPLPCP